MRSTFGNADTPLVHWLVDLYIVDVPTVADSTDDDFFHGIKTNSNHVLQPYLPDKTYRLRTRSHNMTFINKTKFLSDADFLVWMLYKYSY